MKFFTYDPIEESEYFLDAEILQLENYKRRKSPARCKILVAYSIKPIIDEALRSETGRYERLISSHNRLSRLDGLSPVKAENMLSNLKIDAQYIDISTVKQDKSDCKTFSVGEVVTVGVDVGRSRIKGAIIVQKKK